MLLETAFSSLMHELQSTLLPQSVQYVIAISPIIMTILLAWIFWPLWVRYVRNKNFLSIKYTVLELKLPKDTFKSPLAMEVVLNSIHNTSDGSAYSQYWKGETRPWYSLELVSIEGQVKFFIWTEDRRKSGLMAGIYSQFPEIEIIEREDYTRGIMYDPKETKIWAAEFKLTKDDHYPIKTYVDYGLDKDPKEEFKVDPLLPFIEFLGSVGPNQQIWIQIPVRAHKDDQKKPGHWFKKTDLWKDGAAKEINKILMRDPKSKVSGEINPDTGYSKLPTITEGERDIVAAIERGLTKQAFDCGIRAIYMAKRSDFDTPFGIGGIVGGLKHFSSEHLNGFKPNGKKWIAQFDYPWQDYKDIRRNKLSAKVLKAYKRRSYFYPPHESKPFVLNSEELATIYHFPGSVSVTPTLERIPSKKSQAPTNLPI